MSANKRVTMIDKMSRKLGVDRRHMVSAFKLYRHAYGNAAENGIHKMIACISIVSKLESQYNDLVFHETERRGFGRMTKDNKVALEFDVLKRVGFRPLAVIAKK